MEDKISSNEILRKQK